MVPPCALLCIHDIAVNLIIQCHIFSLHPILHLLQGPSGKLVDSSLACCLLRKMSIFYQIPSNPDSEWSKDDGSFAGLLSKVLSHSPPLSWSSPCPVLPVHSFIISSSTSSDEEKERKGCRYLDLIPGCLVVINDTISKLNSRHI